MDTATDMTPEGRVKAKIVTALNKIGAYYFFPVANPYYGKRGVPDIIVCLPPKGAFMAIECKAGKNVATELQERNLRDINICGGIAKTVSEKTIDELLMYLEQRLWLK
jgi:hypothetical protein